MARDEGERTTRRAIVAGVAAASVGGCMDGLTDEFSGSPTSTETTTASESVQQTVAVGEQAATARAVSIEVDSLQAATSLETTGGTITPKAEHAFALARVSATRSGDTPGALPAPDAFRMVTGDARVRRVARIDETTSLREPVQGQFYRGSEGVPPGEGRSGWVVFEIPTTSAEVAVVYEQTEFRDGEEVTTALRWSGTLDVGALPNLVRSVDRPSSIAWGEEVVITYTVENTGGGSGTADLSYSLGCPGRSTYDRSESVTIGAGESISRTIECHPRTFANVTVSFGTETYTIPVRAPRRSYGEAFEIAETARYTVAAPTTASAYEYEVYPGTEEGDPTKQFVFARFTASPIGADAAPIPAYEDFRLTVGERTYEPIETAYPDQGTFVEPVTGKRYTASFTTTSQVQGWLVFEIPQDRSIEESAIDVEWGDDQGGPYRIRWESP
jgi:hypothetical protein